MSTVKLAINGMGRIGRTLVREILDGSRKELEVVAVNNPGDPNRYVQLLKYDSVHGRFNGSIDYDKESSVLTINGNKIKFHCIKDPSEIPWGDDNAEIVIDATGRFKDGPALSAHKRDSVKKVIMCAPGSDLDGTFVMGINHEDYDPSKHHIVSNASCTTNCLAPVCKVLNDKFGIESGFMTTIHSYTSDQQLLDGSHKDPRRARAAAVSMIPTTTGAAKSVGLVIPDLVGKLDGYAVRVPTPNVSMVDLTVNLNKAADIATINQAMKEASETSLKGILGYTEEELVSIDFVGERLSSVFDAPLTNVIGKQAKIVAWYDNEAGFSSRVLDLAHMIGTKL
jgi:glyceraldehyde 3-phosphate dehydrogenase